MKLIYVKHVYYKLKTLEVQNLSAMKQVKVLQG